MLSREKDIDQQSREKDIDQHATIRKKSQKSAEILRFETFGSLSFNNIWKKKNGGHR